MLDHIKLTAFELADEVSVLVYQSCLLAGRTGSYFNLQPSVFDLIA
jgi:hypothetical protein